MTCKIDRVAEAYGLDRPNPRYDDLDEHLLARWTGGDGRRAEGYRPLADWFNRRLLKRVYDEHDRETVGVRLDSEYDALTGDDDLVRREVADDLAADGIDADAVREDMVSWSTMRHHLKGCLDGQKETGEPSDWERRSVAIARDRAETKVGDALRALDSKGELPGGRAADVDVAVRVACPQCHVRVPFVDAVERGYVCEAHLGSADGSSERVDDEGTGVK